ncbi:MAG: methylmalonyl Co-A mutase-associated GTPase MeaB [Deltaproteobacteria bacterium]|nr:methylmalonyl Co-A mutase-associated GTPase MeaB [Deltaproteobacteria bacterium]
MIENREDEAIDILKHIFPHTGKAYIIGVTGNPGTGKSTLVYELTKRFLEKGQKLGIIAIDPSSPFSGGALLGDRVRLEKGDLDQNVFIRSMATRGILGGLSAATRDAVNVMDAMGRDIIIIETVGVGQNEIDILDIDHTTLLVLAPGMGDKIQAMKSGLLEIADIFVVNKADTDGADKTVRDVQSMLSLGPERQGWIPEVYKTIALNGDGISDLIEGIERHKRYLEQNNLLGGNSYSESQLLEIIKERIAERILNEDNRREKIRQYVKKIRKREIDPYTAADMLLTRDK